MPSNLRIKVSSILGHKANRRKHRQFSHDPRTMARDLVTLPLPLERDIDIQQQLGNLTSYKLSNCSTNKWKCSNVSTGGNVIHVPGVGDLPLPQTWTGNILIEMRMYNSMFPSASKYVISSVRNKASSSDNNTLLSCFGLNGLKKIMIHFTIKLTVQRLFWSDQLWFCLTGLKTHFDKMLLMRGGGRIDI